MSLHYNLQMKIVIAHGAAKCFNPPLPAGAANR